MRRVLSVAYAMIVSTKTPEERAELDLLLSDEAPVEVVETGNVRRIRTRPSTAPAPQTEQERQLLARGKAPPEWWPGAAKAAKDNLAAGRAGRQIIAQTERR